VLLTVGRMDSGQRYKGQDRVIAAIPYIVAQGHDVEYVVVGERDDCVRLESLAREVRVSDRVRFLGSSDLQVLTELFRMADLSVMPSTGEGFGIAFLEAMVSGTPTLGLSVAGTTDALADGELGTIVSEPEIPAAIVRILAKPKPDPVALAEATRARFGRSQFAAGVRAALSRRMEAS
jgi:phosphatidylinositol alpha-1,6-mannosyltransferase